jgi:hypothetical protein
MTLSCGPAHARPPAPAPAPRWRSAPSARPPPGRCARALPLDLADAAPLGAAAAAVSLLTAWWAQTAAAAAAAAVRPPPEAPRATAPAAPPAPTSVDEVWAAAWAPFSADAAAVAAAAASSAAGADAALDAPLLWAQGLRRDARGRLLALALAALQAGAPAAGGAAAAAALPPLLGRASLAAAAAWLGYEPASLRAAVAPYLEEEAAQAGGEAGAPPAPAPPLSEGPWFALDERAALYVAVLRLLRSTSIDAGAGAAADSGDADDAGFELALAAPEAAARALRRGGGGVCGWRADGSASSASSSAAPSPLLAAAPAALQDMAVLVADAVAAAYLADAAEGGIPAGALAAAAGDLSVGSSSGGGEARSPAAAASSLARAPVAARAGPLAAPALAPLEAAWWPTFVHPRLASTRALQRFANRLALARAAHRAFASVTAMYEDRLPLFTLCALRAEGVEGAVDGAGVEGATPAATAEVALRVRRVPLRRARELAALRGGRLGVALALEGADVAAPALRALWARAGEFLSWLLVHAVGRAAGLVWRGVREGAAALAAGGGGGGGARRPPRGGGAPAAA